MPVNQQACAPKCRFEELSVHKVDWLRERSVCHKEWNFPVRRVVCPPKVLCRAHIGIRRKF